MFCMVAEIWVSPVSVLIWGAGFISFILGFIIALVHGKPDKRIVRSLVSIPKFVFFQVLSLLQVKKANKVSVATQHYSKKSINDIDNEA